MHCGCLQPVITSFAAAFPHSTKANFSFSKRSCFPKQIEGYPPSYQSRLNPTPDLEDPGFSPSNCYMKVQGSTQVSGLLKEVPSNSEALGSQSKPHPKSLKFLQHRGQINATKFTAVPNHLETKRMQYLVPTLWCSLIWTTR